MSGVQAALLPGGRLHLQHGPTDLVIGAEGARAAAFGAARAAMEGVLERLVGELALLRRPLAQGGAWPEGPVARRMAAAVAGHAGFVTPMAAVAGAVADEVLAAMRRVAGLERAWVNNGGDIALWSAARPFVIAIAAGNGAVAGRVRLAPGDGIGGIATSGRGGRSLSLGIADSVTVLAASAAAADAAATLVANAVDLPGHRAIRRRPARDLQPESDLGHQLVVTGLGDLGQDEIAAALARGARRAQAMCAAGQITGAALFLRGQWRVVGHLPGHATTPEVEHA